ncbi:hypothetical protein CEXT_25521 [Caerostris extrusa]|uniref:Uncharacterized protein n=1 Tax=Caerostris extrusa TaxID=172846 RepID=A0AAV4VYR7_CAEEX|nr:hypothetical protein CEXT_25521 [Caerostris extrusa]
MYVLNCGGLSNPQSHLDIREMHHSLFLPRVARNPNLPYKSRPHPTKRPDTSLILKEQIEINRPIPHIFSGRHVVCAPPFSTLRFSPIPGKR